MIQDQARAALKNQKGSNVEACIFYDSLVAGRVQRERTGRSEFLLHNSRRFSGLSQLKVSLGKKKITGAEALVRWECPGKGMVSLGSLFLFWKTVGKSELWTAMCLKPYVRG